MIEKISHTEEQVLYRSGEPTTTAIIYQGELDFISRCILDYPNIETGGQLFGFWTASGVPVVLYAIGPGQNANHQVAFFNQDIDYLTKVGHVLASRYGLQHIGEWHSHHQLGLPHPSGHDAATMVHGIKRQNLGRFLLCIGTWSDAGSVINAFNFTQDSGSEYVHSSWDIKPGTSPYRHVVDSDADLSQILSVPSAEQARHGILKTTLDANCYTPPLYDETYWLKDKANNKVLKNIVDMFVGLSDEKDCKVQLDQQKMVHLTFLLNGSVVRVSFPQGFPSVPPLVMRDSADVTTADAIWEYDGEIESAFLSYWHKLHLEQKEM
ncbi:MAG: Mov34/MPN/PAD-1 family protein [Kiritimatiellae bacterium]|nr:Mov34/MPN/PAD-1 family protein [Kiritimatiellia bacterium]